MSEKEGCIDPEQGNLMAAYEMGLLPPGDQLCFEKHLAACHACRAQLFEMAPFMRAVQADPGHMAAHLVGLSAMDQAMGTEASRESGWEAASRTRHAAHGSGLRGLLQRLMPKRGWSVAWPVVAPVALGAAVLIAVLIEHWSAPDMRSLARLEHGSALEMPISGEMSGEAGRLMKEGLTAYRNGRYEQGAGLLAAAARAAAQQIPGAAASGGLVARQAAEGWLYAGLCFLQAQEADSAVFCLQRAFSSPSSAAAEHARWYLAQASLLRGDAAGAAEQLSALAAGSPRYRQQAADQLRAIDLLRAR